MEYIRWFDEINASNIYLVGGKGANLGEMIGSGLPVPPGFYLTAHSYRDFIEATGLNQTFQNILADIDMDDPADVEAKTGRIRALITEQTIPVIMAQQILSSYRQLGHREVRLDILFPTWCEDPAPVLNFVRSYLDVGEEQSPRLQQERLITQRQQLTERVRSRLAQDPRGRYLVWPLFRWLLDHIEFHTRERDTMHFEMTRLFPSFRRILFELGRRWSQNGLIAEPNDIFFLRLDEMETIAEAPTPMQETIRIRREEYELNKGRPWPDIIKGEQEIYAKGVSVTGDSLERLKGVSGSPGRVTGQARVIQGPEEFHRLQKGDILVAPITNPVWTPIFAIASGVVTEVGGILSHGAIVAREYGIPAVMSIAGATRSVPDGQIITVDGNKGMVYLVEAGA